MKNPRVVLDIGVILYVYYQFRIELDREAMQWLLLLSALSIGFRPLLS